MQDPTILGRVLVIEDDDAIRTMLLSVLEVAGYDVLGVHGGLEALTLMTEWRPDVIVLDLFLPLMDGYELLARRSASADLARIPVIVVTTSTALLPSAERLGVWAVIQRPHDVNQLRALTSAALGRARAGGGGAPPGSIMH